MGVEGLKALIDKNKGKLKKGFKLQPKQRLVIDGKCLMYSLFRKSAQEVPHYLYGTDYNRFAQTIHKFFRTLERCDIRPLVVFDGRGNRPEDRREKKIWSDNDKMDTWTYRFNEQLKLTAEISNGNLQVRAANNVIGFLADEVFIQVVEELSIPLVKSYEADKTVATIANQFQCPVVSDDTDFCIFDIKEGVIWTEELVETVIPNNIPKPDECQQPINCWLYHTDCLIEYFPDLRSAQVLPIFASLNGNDYIKRGHFTVRDTSGHSTDAIDIIRRHELRSHCRHDRLQQDQRGDKELIRMLDRLRNWSRDELIDILRDKYPNDMDLLETSINSYSIEESTEDFDIPEDPEQCQSVMQSIVDRIVDRIKRDINPMSGDGERTARLKPGIEDHSLPSSYTPTLEIRRYLLALGKENDLVKPIKVYDREGSNCKNHKLMPGSLITPNGQDVPNKHQIDDLSDSELQELIFEILSINQTDVDTIMEQFSGLFETEELNKLVYLIIAVKYWLNKCTHEGPKKAFVCSLLAAIVFGGYVGDHRDTRFIKLNDQKKGELMAIFEELNSCPDKSRFKVRFVHFFTEYQNCLLVIRKLNQTLKSVLPMGSLFCLNGVFIYKLTVELSEHNEPTERFSELLSGVSPRVQQLVHNLIDTINKIMNDTNKL